MPSASRRPARLQSLSFAAFSLAIMVMAGEWIVLVAGTHLHEMIVGAASIIATSIFLFFVHRSSKLHIEWRAADVASGWRIPAYIAIDTYIIIKVLFQDLFSTRSAGSFYRVAGFRTSKREPYLVGRRVLATVYTTTTPNAIVIGIDSAQSRMLFHQLQRTSLQKMTEELGARP
jgi:hypothetical protein